MAEAEFATRKRYAVVTGSNKGLGLEICRQLASKGIIVVLTARDEKKGIEALEKLKREGVGLSGENVVFHQLNVVNPSSIAALADFVRAQFGKLDILVNNAGIFGVVVGDYDATQVSVGEEDRLKDWIGKMKQTYDLAEECLETNYCGAKRMIEAFIPLLQLSDSPRIVNVSSSAGRLRNIPSDAIKGVLNNTETLNEEKTDELFNEFLKDFREGSLEKKGWPQLLAAYTVSKATMNAYTRILAKKYPSFRINCVCPGYIKTDFNNNSGILSVEEGAECPVKLAVLPDDGPSGVFFVRNEVSSFE